ncbi:hepatic lectin-like [Cololabis saira]|uniref:hepatic lectin-like n=1 Tax=Cololabis saira TaxID=129043 RepID=UPI002AD2FCCF|nr:hepatic lectin-like [Cololabis saira]
MSTEIQTAPDLRVKFSKEVHRYGRDKDQCEIQTLDEGNQLSDLDLQQTEKNNQKKLRAVKRKSFRVFKVFLGVFYLLVLVGFIIRSLLVSLEVNQLKSRFNEMTLDKNQLQTEHDQLNTSYSRLEAKHDQLNNTYNQLKDDYLGGWRRFGSSFYKRFPESKTWSESRRECEERGADLVIINSKEEQDFVRRLNTNKNSWIGLKAEWSWEQGHEWKWVDGSPVTTTFWAAGSSPHQDNQVEYAAVCCNNEGKWTFSYHTYYKNWICEKKIHVFIVES